MKNPFKRISLFSGNVKPGPHADRAGTRPLTLESLEQRLLLSVLDFAGDVIAEDGWDHVGPQQIDDGQAVGIKDAEIENSADVDSFSFETLGGAFAEGAGELDVLMEITGGGEQDITALASGDNDVFFIAGNSLWHLNAPDELQSADLLAPRSTIAGFIGQDEAEMTVSDLAVTAEGEVLLAFAGLGEIVRVDGEGELVEIIGPEEMTAITGENAVDIVSLAVDEDGVIYAADGASLAILEMSPPEEDKTGYTIEFYATANDLAEILETEVFDDFGSGVLPVPQTVIAQSEDGGATTPTFSGNALVYGSGNYDRDGYDVYYVSQLGQDFDLDGTIVRVEINEEDPDDVTFSDFYNPGTSTITSDDEVDATTLNPSALAMDTSGAFGGRMFLGTFGENLGDAHDGKIFSVDTEGNLTELSLRFEDQDGNTVLKDGLPVEGFFDITDMAFSQGGDFGEYLYVLSENVDSNGAAEGGFSSDLWRISLDGPDATAGVAELFVPDVADGAITLAFSDQADWRYAGDLYIGTFVDGGRLLRINGEGETEQFYTFSAFGSSYRVADIAFAPYSESFESPMEGFLMVDVQTPGGTASLVQLNPDAAYGEISHFWGHEFNIGDVSGGDLVFDGDANLIISLGGEENLTRIDYQTALDYTFKDLDVRTIIQEFEADDFDPEDPEYVEVTTHTPYILLEIAGAPRIVGLGEAGDGADIATEVSPNELDIGETPANNTKNVSFTFNDEGDIYIYINNADRLISAEREDTETATKEDPVVAGVFQTFAFELGAGEIEESTALVDVQTVQLAWTQDGSLYTIAANGSEGENGETPGTTLDDQIVLLLDTDTPSVQTETRAEVADLTRLQVMITRPDSDEEIIYEISPEDMLTIAGDARLRNLSEGIYTLTITPLTPASVEYDVLISAGARRENSLTIDADTPLAERTLRDAAGGEMVIRFTGPGSATLNYEQKSTGAVVNLTDLVINEGHKKSELVFENDAGNGWDVDDFRLEMLTVNGSMGRIALPFDIDTLQAAEGTRGNLYAFETAGQVRNVELEEYHILDFSAAGLGDDQIETDETTPVFEAQTLRNLYIGGGNGTLAGGISHIDILKGNTVNRYQDITVEGAIGDSTIGGLSLQRLRVENRFDNMVVDPDDPEADPIHAAIYNSQINLHFSRGSAGEVIIEQGGMLDSALTGGRMLHEFRIEDGHLTNSQITTRFFIRNLAINGDYDPLDEEDTDGSVINSTINANGKLVSFQTSGYVDANSTISARTYFWSLVHNVVTGGDFAGTISASKVNRVLVGFDAGGQRQAEDPLDTEEGYFGSDFTGQINSLFYIIQLNVTGKIEDASLQTSWRHILNIFAEDGVIDTQISAAGKVGSILVGYIDGRRSLETFANPDADVSGSISARLLTRIYYTGDLTMDLDDVAKVHVLRDDVPSLSAAIDYEALEEAGRLVETDAGGRQILEGDSGTSAVPVVFTLDQKPAQTVSFTYETAFNTADEQDVAATGPTTVVFNKGQTSRTIDVPLIIGDGRFETAETFSLVLDNAEGVSLDTEEVGIVIADDDESPVVRIGEDMNIAENDSGTQSVMIDVTVEVNAPTDLPIRVVYTTAGGTATAEDNDFEHRVGVLEFDPVDGPLSKSISLTINGDETFEADEIFYLNLTAAENALIDEGQATITIQNDDEE